MSQKVEQNLGGIHLKIQEVDIVKLTHIKRWHAKCFRFKRGDRQCLSHIRSSHLELASIFD